MKNSLSNTRLWTEAFVVSGLLTLVFTIVRAMIRFKSVTVQVALTGLLGHVIMEVARVNEYYCNNGNSCIAKKV